MASEIIYLDEAQLDRMAVDQRFVQVFPILTTLSQQAPTCSPCKRQAAPDRAQSYGSVKTYFGTMSDALKIQLKQMLNTKKIRVVYKKTPTTYEKLTF